MKIHKGGGLMRKFFYRFSIGLLMLVFASFLHAEDKVLQTQESSDGFFKVQLVDCKRKGDKLTIKLRIVNPSDKQVRYCLCKDGTMYYRYYLIAKDKKYFILTDSQGVALAPQGNDWVDIAPKGVYNWWGKFTAPPKEIKKITFIMPNVMPFEDIPITDE